MAIDKQVVFATKDDLGHFFAEAIDITPRGEGWRRLQGLVSLRSKPSSGACAPTLRSSTY